MTFKWLKSTLFFYIFIWSLICVSFLISITLWFRFICFLFYRLAESVYYTVNISLFYIKLICSPFYAFQALTCFWLFIFCKGSPIVFCCGTKLKTILNIKTIAQTYSKTIRTSSIILKASLSPYCTLCWTINMRQIIALIMF